MPVSIVVGGQFGSEGKGKVALEIARRSEAPVTVVRVGGPNSGHTGYDRSGKKWALRQLPAASVDRNVDVVIPPGAYIDLDVFLEEVETLDFPRDRIFVSPFARIITVEHKQWERDAGLTNAIGSTGSGVGAAVIAAAARGAQNSAIVSVDAEHSAPLDRYLCDTSHLLRRKLKRSERIVVEGTQGFGLSLLDGGYWPKATSRFTTAAGALAEASLSPLDVDDITLVIRTYPIRVAGDSGPLHGETTWSSVADTAGRSHEDLREYTTVTNRLRRVGKFDAKLVKRALESNAPSRIALNHLDYIGSPEDLKLPCGQVRKFLDEVESNIEHKVDWYGFSPYSIVEADEIDERATG